MAETLVIIGSGPAGWTAAIYAARANLQPLVFEGAVTAENAALNKTPLGQLAWTTEVENFPGFLAADSAALAALSRSALAPERYARLKHLYEGKRAHTGKRTSWGPEMMEYMRQQALNFGTRVETDDIVKVELGKRPFCLHAGQGQRVEAAAVIVATGARANYLPDLPSQDRFKNHGVSACAVCDGALMRFRDQPVVVVGGGDSACEEANHLSRFASTVYMVHRRDELRASKIMQERVRANPRITLKWNRAVAEVLGDDETGVHGVRLRSTLDKKEEETIPATGMFVAIGHTPNVDFLGGQLKTDGQGFIKLTDAGRTYTSVEGVFAAGDVADPTYKQAVTAAAMGCKAAIDAERWLAEAGIH